MIVLLQPSDRMFRPLSSFSLSLLRSDKYKLTIANNKILIMSFTFLMTAMHRNTYFYIGL